MNLIDILVFLLIAAVVVSRFLKFKLPRDPRDKAARKADWGRLRQGLFHDDAAAPVQPQQGDAQPALPKTVGRGVAKDAGKGLEGIAKVKAMDPAFDEVAFLEGAKDAYTYFYRCWNDKDEDALGNLCAPVLFNRVAERWDSKAWAPVTVDSIESAVISGARVHGRTAIITVAFKAVQREGAGVPKTVNSRWTLARPLSSDDPNWELQEMTTGVDA